MPKTRLSRINFNKNEKEGENKVQTLQLHTPASCLKRIGNLVVTVCIPKSIVLAYTGVALTSTIPICLNDYSPTRLNFSTLPDIGSSTSIHQTNLNNSRFTIEHLNSTITLTILYKW